MAVALAGLISTLLAVNATIVTTIVQLARVPQSALLVLPHSVFSQTILAVVIYQQNT